MKIGNQVFLANSATVVGNVVLGDQSSIWFGAVVRGDVENITIGARTNIQDLAVLHADPGMPAQLGESVTVGHGAIVHGATIGDYTLVGMRATVLNGAEVGKYCVIGAHSLVTEGMSVPDYSVVMGTPGRVVKQLGHEDRVKLATSAEHYVGLAKAYLDGRYGEHLICQTPPQNT